MNKLSPFYKNKIEISASEYSESYERMIKKLVINYKKPVIKKNLTRTTTGGYDLLIITRDDCINEAIRLKNHKNREIKHGGKTIKPIISTEVVTLSQIKARQNITGNLTAVDIRYYINEKVYEVYNAQLKYIILMGDVHSIPTFYGNGIATDLYYGMMDLTKRPGDTYELYLPEIIVGRLPLDDISNQDSTSAVAEAKYFVDRIENYESKTVFGLSNNKVLFTYQDDSDKNDNKEIKDRITNFGSKLLNNTIEGKLSTDYSEINQELQIGQKVIFYHGHGDVFNPEDVDARVRNFNSQSQPLILHVTCQTGHFDYTNYNLNSFSYGEYVLKKLFEPNFDTNKKAIGFIGGSRDLHFTLAEEILRGFVESLNQNPVKIGDILNGARLEILSAYAGGNYLANEHFELLNLLGDPTIEIKFCDPRPFAPNSCIQCTSGSCPNN